MIRISTFAVLALAVLACSGDKKETAPQEAAKADKGTKATKAAKGTKVAKAGKGTKAANTTKTKPTKPTTPPASSHALPATDKLAAKSPGGWVVVGKTAAWKQTRLAVILGDHLFSIERGDGRLFKTLVATGKYSTIGKGDFGDSRWLLASATEILTIEADGRLFRINANDGTWTVSKGNTWKRTRLAAVRGGYLYTIERGDSRLFKTEIATGNYVTIGKGDYGDSKWMFATADALYTVEKDGRMFRINANDGTWKVVAGGNTWKRTRLATVFRGHLYTIERGDGRLFKTNLATGKYVTIGKGDYGDSRRLLATSKALVTIEADGRLFRIHP